MRTRRKYTDEFKREAVRLAKTGQSLAAMAKSLGLAEQTQHSCVRVEKQGQLGGTPAAASLKHAWIERHRAQ